MVQLKRQWTHHACVSGQNLSWVPAIVLYFAKLPIGFFFNENV